MDLCGPEGTLRVGVRVSVRGSVRPSVRTRVGVRVSEGWAIVRFRFTGLGLGFTASVGGLFPHTHACEAGWSDMRFSDGGQWLRVRVRGLRLGSELRLGLQSGLRAGSRSRSRPVL